MIEAMFGCRPFDGRPAIALVLRLGKAVHYARNCCGIQPLGLLRERFNPRKRLFLSPWRVASPSRFKSNRTASTRCIVPMTLWTQPVIQRYRPSQGFHRRPRKRLRHKSRRMPITRSCSWMASTAFFVVLQHGGYAGGLSEPRRCGSRHFLRALIAAAHDDH